MGGVLSRRPSNQNDISSRIFMVALGGISIGAILAVIVGTLMSSATGGGFPKAIIFGAFLLGAAMGSSLMFRICIPVSFVLWHAKEPEARRRVIQTLAQGMVVSPSAEASHAAEPISGDTTAMSEAFAENDAGRFHTPTESTPSSPPAATSPVPADATPPPTPSATPPTPSTPAALPTAATAVAESALESLIARARSHLESFVDGAMAEVTAARPMLNPSDRQAVSLYVAGATQTVADRNAFDAMTTVALVRYALERSGLSPEEADAFLLELSQEAERPRFRRMIEHGAGAMATRIDDPNAVLAPPLNDLLTAWNDPTGQTAGPQQITFLITDIVGSTALTSQIGNAGAQRVVRAHNAIARTAAKAFKGREVKHTGDGMLLTFPDPTAGVKAAMDIQQEAANYAHDNPSAPLVLRIGVHIGDAVLEDNEYYGSAVSVVNGVCALVDGGEICCTTAIRRKVSASAFRFEDLGTRSLKGGGGSVEVSKVLWEPKRQPAKGVVEYRQIGTAPTAGNS